MREQEHNESSLGTRTRLFIFRLICPKFYVFLPIVLKIFSVFVPLFTV